MPQGLKPPFSGAAERPEAEASGYLEARPEVELGLAGSKGPRLSSG
jgi:hypothetical protein